MNKRLIPILILLLPGIAGWAQDYISLRGQTRDSTLSIVPFANVMLVDTTSQEMEGFAVSDVDGNFILRLKKNTVYELQVTYVGYTPYRQIIRLGNEPSQPLIIVLQEAISQLDEVTVVADMPVLVRGDTISYKAEAFARGDERKLEDVLEELPGFNIRENGDIEVQGQRVDKVMVDGKEFFEGDTKLATKNIPADVVDRVQVLQNFNDIAPMRGLGDNEQLALNIELKDDKKRMVFGDIEMGGGPESRYFGHANTFYYAPETSINFIGDANNVGELALSLNDYFRMSGGMASMASRNGTNFRMNAGDAGIPLTDRNSAQDLSSNLTALNLTSRLSEKIQLSGFAIGFDTDNAMGSNSLRTYPQLNDQTQEQLNTISSIMNRSGLARFSAKYTPNYNMQVDYSFFGKRSTIEQSRLRNSELLSGSNALTENIDRMPSDQTHQLRMFNALNERNIIAAEVSYSREQNVSDQFLTSEALLFSNYLPMAGSNLRQDQGIRSRRMDASVSYWYILNKSTHINVSGGINQSYQRLISDLDSDQTAIEQLNENMHITNRFGSIQYRKRWNKLTISPTISFNTYTFDMNSERPETSSYLFPRMTAEYEFGNSHSLRVNYSQSLEYNDISSYTEGFILQRYNTLSFGNAGLKPAVSHRVNATYTNYNMYNFFNIYAGINFQHIEDGFTQNQQLSGVENVMTAINAAAANQIATAYTMLEKRFDHWRLSVNANLSHTTLNNAFNGEVIENNNFTQQYGISSSARIYKLWTLRAGYQVSVNRYASGGLTNTFYNYRPNVSTTLKFKGFRLDTDYAYNKYVGQMQRTTFDMLDASLSYRKGKSPWEFKVQGFNLLDTRTIRQDSFSDNLISTYAYYIQQRYGLFTVKFDL